MYTCIKKYEEYLRIDTSLILVATEKGRAKEEAGPCYLLTGRIYGIYADPYIRFLYRICEFRYRLPTEKLNFAKRNTFNLRSIVSGERRIYNGNVK